MINTSEILCPNYAPFVIFNQKKIQNPNVDQINLPFEQRSVFQYINAIFIEDKSILILAMNFWNANYFSWFLHYFIFYIPKLKYKFFSNFNRR